MIIRLDAVLTAVDDSFKYQLSNKARTFPKHSGGNNTPATTAPAKTRQELRLPEETESDKGWSIPQATFSDCHRERVAKLLSEKLSKRLPKFEKKYIQTEVWI